MKKTYVISLFLLGFLLHFMYGYIEWVPESSGNFQHVMREGIAIENNPRVIDMAMLGAHDAFSHDIHILSALDPAESPSALVSQTPLRFFLGGLFVRYAKAQTTNTETMLNRGVRYFDIRVSYAQGNWVTKHGLISNSLRYYLTPMVTFLIDHPGEFVILDFQHVYLGNQTYQDLFNAIEAIQVEGKSLFDFVHYDSSIPISVLTYDDVTQQKTNAGVIFLFNADSSTNDFRHYSRLDEASLIRSTWHDTPHLATLIERIEQEHKAIEDLDDRDFLSVNQAQRTPNFSDGLWDTLIGGSLISMARNGNPTLLEHEQFTSWFQTMPIIMVDCATCNHQSFNVLVNEAIIAYNLTL